MFRDNWLLILLELDLSTYQPQIIKQITQSHKHEHRKLKPQMNLFNQLKLLERLVHDKIEKSNKEFRDFLQGQRKGNYVEVSSYKKKKKNHLILTGYIKIKQKKVQSNEELTCK